MKKHHTPVLLNESIDLLITERSGYYFDGTAGFGGHSEEILKRLSNNAKLVCTDVDRNAFEYCRQKFSDDVRVSVYNFNFSFVDVITKIESIENFDGIIADLGVSSFQLDDPESGFAFKTDTKLDLRMDKTKKITAADIVNTFTEEDLADLFFNYGEEKNSRRIAKKIVEQRTLNQISTSAQMTEIISELVPPNYRVKTLSRIFQALRIFVNDELDNLNMFLENATKVLKNSGRLVVITYHSLEDRIVKEFFKNESLTGYSPKEDPLGTLKRNARLKIITKKPVLPPPAEIEMNYRARSAKLRVAQKI